MGCRHLLPAHPPPQPILTLPASPQVGNAAFADDYNAAAPDTWSISNGEVRPGWVDGWVGGGEVGQGGLGGAGWGPLAAGGWLQGCGAWKCHSGRSSTWCPTSHVPICCPHPPTPSPASHSWQGPIPGVSPTTLLPLTYPHPPVPPPSSPPQDPIPWIPKIGFKRCGQRVTVNSRVRADIAEWAALEALGMGLGGAQGRPQCPGQSVATTRRVRWLLSIHLAGGWWWRGSADSCYSPAGHLA